MGEPFRLSADGRVFELVHWPIGASEASGHRPPRAGMTRAAFGNMALHVEDEASSVIGRRRTLAARLDLPFEHLTTARQVHGSRVAVVGPKDVGRGRDRLASAIPDADALITKTDALLVLFYADCLPLYFYAPGVRAVGLAHAGWRGTAANIAASTLSAFRQAFAVSPSELFVVIGPGICGRDYEVDRPVAEIFAANFGDAVPGLMSRGDGKYLLDLVKINRFLLEQAGIPSTHIEWTNRCTTEPGAGLFSYRRDGRRAGRMAAYIALPSDRPNGGEHR
ncbi:MAG: peptidoglycan editing factor PgeF [Hydrogenibacillus sp.]|nr:peptidoglycan editing factor PgeF [Hydrogenibacillus sp.]